MPDLALLLCRLGLAALYLESAVGVVAGFLLLIGPFLARPVAQSPRVGNVRCG